MADGKTSFGKPKTKSKAVPTVNSSAGLLPKEPPIPTFGSGALTFPQRRCPFSFPELTDLQVFCSDKVAVPVERTMLARFSQQMSAMLFSSQMKEAKTGVVTFAQIRSSVFILLYRTGLGEFFRCEEVSRPFSKLNNEELFEAIRFAHTFEFQYILPFLLRDLLQRRPEQRFFDLDSELELGIQSNLLDKLLVHLQNCAPEDAPVFSDVEIYRTVWPTALGNELVKSEPGPSLRENFVHSLRASGLLATVILSEGLELRFLPKSILAQITEGVDGETAKNFLLRVFRA